jgi:hypothetical protein
VRKLRISIPGLAPFTLYVREARKSCEHFCFIGATVDAVCYLVHYEAFIAVAIGKLAFAAGAIGVYLLHAEERYEHSAKD